MARRHGKVDLNQEQIVGKARRLGASVVSLADVGGGVPDLLVAIHGVIDLWEVKSAKGTLTKDQKTFHAAFKGSIQIIRSADDAVHRIQELGVISRGRPILRKQSV